MPSPGLSLGLEPVTSLGTVSTAPSENLDGKAGKRVGETTFSIQAVPWACQLTADR